MKKMLLTCAALAVLGVSAHATPVKLTKAQMDQIVAGKLTELPKVNGGGHTPNGAANGVPGGETVNPSGHAPSGHNK